MSSTTPSGTSTLQLILAWSFVGIPFVWGVLETVRNALTLLR